MRKTFLGILAIMALGASASITMPIDYMIDFADTDISGWIQYSSGQTPAAAYASYFDDDNSYALLPYSGGVAAMSCSQFTEGGESDEWLITPEFEVSGDNMALFYTVLTTGNSLNNKYRIMVSESGVEKDDFKTIVNNVVKGEASKEGISTRCSALTDYAGKKIRLALVNFGNTSGMLGFANVGVGDYYINVAHADTFDYMIIDDPTEPVSMSVSMSTPVKSNGFTAVLETDDFTSEFVSTKLINISSISKVDFTFPDKFNFDGNHSYSITITPEYEGAVPTVIEGTIIVANPVYPPVAIVEELTSTKCTYCPRGTAFLNYYKNKYDGSGDGGKFIASAVHYYMSGNDPMIIKNNVYPDALETCVADIDNSRAGLLPSAVYNRLGVSDPSTMPIENIMKQKAVAKANINKVEYAGEAGGKVTVDFSTELSFGAEDAGVNYSFVVIENDVTGSGSDWLQVNAFSGVSQDAVISTYGADLVPYFEPFIYGSGLMEMEYNDVARGCFPSFTGNVLDGEFVAYEPREFSFEFNMPSNVAKVENTEIILIITSRASGKILAGDALKAADFNKEISGVKEIRASSADRIFIMKEGDGMRVYSPAEGDLSVYYADGRCFGNFKLKEADNFIPCATGSLMIFNARTSAGAKSFKIHTSK